jgi:hypothetical protein
MPVSTLPLAERIARIIAARAVSRNAEGDEPSAADVVDDSWRDYRGDAISILRTMREPDAGMADAGDVAVWRKMIDAALIESAIEAS